MFPFLDLPGQFIHSHINTQLNTLYLRDQLITFWFPCYPLKSNTLIFLIFELLVGSHT